jgi:HK97 family phage major capsid protein
VTLKQSKVPIQYRALEFGTPTDAGTIPVTLSSEFPVQRYNWVTDERYVEILDHSPDAVDLTRAARGIPLLMDHDSRAQVGRIDNVRLEDGRLRGNLRFSKRADVAGIAQDVMDGIRQEMSVGYRVTKMTMTEKDANGVPTYRCQWMPFEGTLTAIPADPTIGVGRSESDRAAFPVDVEAPDDPAPEPEETRKMSEKDTPAPAPGPVAVVTDHRKEMADIAAICKAAGKGERAADFIADGKTLPEVKEVLFREAIDASKAGSKVIDLTPAEKRHYSFRRAIAAASENNWRDAGFEKEVNDTISKRMGKEGSNSLFIPSDLEVRALGSAVGGSGAEFKFTQPKPFIELLREKAVVRALGATFLTGLTGPIAFPRQTAAGAASWRTEVPGSDLSDTDSTYETLSMTPKTIQRNTAVSRQLIFQASEDIENLIRSDLAAVLAIALDQNALQGGGSNAPLGLIGNTNVSTVTLGTNAGTITLAALVGLEKSVAQANADLGSMAVVTNAQQRSQARQVQYFSGTNGIPLWSGGTSGDGLAQGGMILSPASGANGYPAFVSQQIPSNLTKGTNTTICSAWLFGRWSEMFVGEWGALELIVDPYSKKKQALIELTAIMYADVGLRHYGSFAKIQDAL